MLDDRSKITTTDVQPTVECVTRAIKVLDPMGIHARPSAAIAKMAGDFVRDNPTRQVRVGYSGHEVNAASICDVMGLAVGGGNPSVTFKVTGIKSDAIVFLERMEAALKIDYSQEKRASDPVVEGSRWKSLSNH